MTPEETRKLVDLLDENRTGKPLGDQESHIDQDAETAQEWYYLTVAVDAIRNTGLHEKVAAVREGLRAEQDTTETKAPEQYIAAPANQKQHATENSSGAIVRSLGKYSFRAAACILVIASSTVIYKYLTVSSSSLYDRYYSTYALNTSRGESTEQPIVTAYNSQDWNKVIAMAAAAGARDNQTEFLAGMADMQLNRCDDAITHFEQVIASNAQAGTDYYQDEAEYYLAISWLACKKVNQAMPILEKIKADKNHKYHQKVVDMSFFDLRLAQYKENK